MYRAMAHRWLRPIIRPIYLVGRARGLFLIPEAWPEASETADVPTACMLATLSVWGHRISGVEDVRRPTKFLVSGISTTSFLHLFLPTASVAATDRKLGD